MYGKHFASTYTGSMFGAGLHVFGVWGYVIANANDGLVELNPSLLAATLGADVGQVEAAIEFLCSPDIKSRSQEEEGRRLIREGAFSYRVVNHSKYREIRNEVDRREYMRDYMRKRRAEDVSTVNTAPVSTVSPSRSRSSKQKKKEQPPAARGVDNSADAFRLAPYLDAYQERFPGSAVPAARFGKTLKALEAKHGAGETLRRWAIFLAAKGELGPEYFARTWSEWDGAEEPTDAAIAWDGIVSAGLRMWRERTWTPEHHAEIAPGTKAGLSTIGGFRAINEADEFGRKSLRKQFIAAYRAASNGGK